MTDTRRAVSTAVDVAFALMILSASVVIVTTQTDLVGGKSEAADDSGSVGDNTASEFASTLTSVTAAVRYDVVISIGSDSTQFSFVNTGSIASHIKRLLFFEMQVGDQQLVDTNYEERLRLAIDKRLSSSIEHYRIVGQWEPYSVTPGDPDSDAKPYIYAEKEIGEDPPDSERVGSAVISLSSGMATSESIKEASYAQGIAKPMAETIVKGLFDSSLTQFALVRGLESQGFAMNRYRRMSLLLAGGGDIISLMEIEAQFSQTNKPDIPYLNKRLADQLEYQIQQDIQNADASVEEIRKTIETGTVYIIVNTWE